MPSLIGSGPSSAGRTGIALLAAAGLAMLLLVALYLAWPGLMAFVAPRLAGALGVDELSLQVGRPGLAGMAVEVLEVRAGRLHVVVEQGRLRYRAGGLLAGRLASAEFRRGTISVAPESAARSGVVAESPSNGGPLQPDALLAALPADRLGVERLQVRVPAAGFRATGSLHADRQRLVVHLLGEAPAEAERFELRAALDAAGAVTARLAERGATQEPAIDLTLRVLDSSLAVDGRLALAGYPLELAGLLAGLPAGAGAVEGSFHGRLPWPVPDDGDWSAAHGEGRLDAHWQPAGSPWSVSEATAHWQLEHGSWRGEVAGALTVDGRTLQITGAVQRLEPAGATGAGTFVATAGSEAAGTGADPSPLVDLSWRLEPDRLHLDGRVQGGDAQLDWLPADLRPPGSGVVAAGLSASLAWPLPERWQSLDVAAEGTLSGHWRVPHPPVGVRQLRGEWRFGQGRLRADLTATLEHRELGLPLRLELAALEPLREPIAAHGALVLGGGLRAPFRLDHDPRSGTGAASIELDHRIEAPLAQALVDGWDEPVDLADGRIALAAQLGWSAAGAGAGRVAVTLDDVAGRYADYRLSGLTGNLDLTAREGVWSLAPARLHVDQLDTGVVLQDIDTGVAWSDDRVTIDGVSARLLGGRAHTGPFAYRLSDGEADLVVDLEDVSLARVLELEGEHITGTGTLTGRLPVQVRDHAPSVIAGRIAAAPPGGRIRVSPALAAGTGQPGLDFALRALQDFRYTALEADVGYTGAGDLTLAVRLQGRNPEVEAGRPIHYNLTVTENVPTLLRSLRLQDDVTREIERRVTD